MIQVQEVMQACMMYGVPIDQMTAQQLIQQIAGADRRITETEFGLPSSQCGRPARDLCEFRVDLR